MPSIKFISLLLLFGVAFGSVQLRSGSQVQAGHHQCNPETQQCTGHTPVRICHATKSETNPYVEITVDDDAVDGNGNGNSDHNQDGHQDGEDIIPPGLWDEDGRNWTPENIAIWENGCILPIATPTPEPTTSPNPSPVPTPTPEPTASPNPSPVPTPTPEPTVSPNPTTGKKSELQTTALNCTNTEFDALIRFTENGQPRENVSVTFRYNGKEESRKSNSDGWAQVGFSYSQGAVLVVSPSDDYASHAREITLSDSCGNVQLDPSITSIGGSGFQETGKRSYYDFEGEVLGVSTLPETGITVDAIIQGIGPLGATLTLAGSLMYARKRS